MRCIFFLLFSAASVCAQTSNNLYFPPKTGNTWQTITPQSEGFCPERIDSLYRFLEKGGTKSFILLKNGSIVLEKYFGAYTQDSLWYWASAGKSLTAYLTGLAQQEGLLNINDRTDQYLGVGWTTCPPAKEALITLRHQLTMTTGLNDNLPPTAAVPDPDNCPDPACLKYLADAGTRWAYHNAPYRLLHDVMAKASGQNINQFTQTRLFAKVGMKGLWINHIMYGRARDMARFGLLALAKGVWAGDTIVRNTQYINAMTQPSQVFNKSYGYLWWLNGQTSFMLPGLQLVFPGKLIPNAPDDLFAALGKNDQKIHIVPSKGWVVVRQGNVASIAPNGAQVPIIFDNQLWQYLNLLQCGATVTDETTELRSLVISPNPTAHNWLISNPSGHIQQLRLTNTQGQLCWSAPGLAPEETRMIPGEALAAGVYFLSWKEGALQKTTRLVKIGSQR